jgi:hypothetical protein
MCYITTAIKDQALCPEEPVEVLTLARTFRIASREQYELTEVVIACTFASTALLI